MITQSELKNVLHYDQETGIFTWKVNSARRVKIGDVAGSIDKKRGYLSINIKRKKYFAHRLAWIYVTGNQPINDIDHINHNTSDNRFINLREATRSENLRNVRSRKSTSKFLGVHWDKSKSRWIASITEYYKTKKLGAFLSELDAALAYDNAAKVIHKEFANLNFK